MAESKNLYELTSKLNQVGYNYMYNEDTEVTLTTSKDYCIKLIVDVEDLGDSVSLIIELIWDDVNIKTKTCPNITVSNAILILTNILENIKKIDEKVHRCLDSFDTIMYPVGVGISKAVKDIEDGLKSCGFTNLCGEYFIKCFDGGLGVIVSEEKRLVEIFISIGRSDFLIYRREINVLYIKEMWAEIENIIDRFKQEFPANDNVAAETIFKNI